jgi:flagellum-specific ATP synthase
MPVSLDLENLRAMVGSCAPVHRVGRICDIRQSTIQIRGGEADWQLGDRIRLMSHPFLTGEIVALHSGGATALTDGSPEGSAIGDGVERIERCGISPHESWIGRIIDPFGAPLDGRPIVGGQTDCPILAAPPPATERKRLGGRLETGTAIFNTFLPIVRGQRIGLFAGSGVGKSSLLGTLARAMTADVCVIALIGERGREVREFVESTLGPEGLARSVVVAATADRSPLVRRKCAWSAMAIAEYFRDQGRQVLFFADSVTRFAEAHREIAQAAGEPPTVRGFPGSTAQQIMALAERAGPGREGSGDITAILSVLVAASDMDEPVADILRGVLDGHIVMEREIAERGRYPAINLLRSVSRSLPGAATEAENAVLTEARRLLAAYDKAELMIQSGLYARGSDPTVDAAIRVWPALDAFLAESEDENATASFARLAQIVGRAGR